jgi:hypothetical protein
MDEGDKLKESMNIHVNIFNAIYLYVLANNDKNFMNNPD